MVNEGNVDVLTGIVIKVNHHGVPTNGIVLIIHHHIEHLCEIGLVGAGGGNHHFYFLRIVGGATPDVGQEAIV